MQAMMIHLRLILISILFFSCNRSIGTDEQEKEYSDYQSIFLENKALLLNSTRTIDKIEIASDVIQLSLDNFTTKYKIEPTKIADFLDSLSSLADLFKNTPGPDSIEDKLLVSKIQECFEILDISIKTGFSFNVSKVDTTKITEIGNDTIRVD